MFAGGLEPIDVATTVDNTGDEPIVTDGPFAESKEWLGGFWVIEAPDLDAALPWADRGSTACAGKVEVRPFQYECRRPSRMSGASGRPAPPAGGVAVWRQSTPPSSRSACPTLPPTPVGCTTGPRRRSRGP